MIDWLSVRAIVYTIYHKLGFSHERITKALDKIPQMKIEDDNTEDIALNILNGGKQ